MKALHWLAALLLFAAGTALAQDAEQTRKLHDLFDRAWEAGAERHPEWSTYRGDLRYNDRLGDASFEAAEAWDARQRGWLAEARAIPRDALSPTDRVSLDLFTQRLHNDVAMQPFTGWRTLLLGALGGAHMELSGLMRHVPVQTPLQARQLLQRMAAYPRLVDQQIAWLRKGIALGWVGARPVVERALQQIDGQMPAELEAGPFYAPFKRQGADIPEAERARLQQAGRDAVAQHVLPALRRLRAFVADEYLPRAPSSGALGSYPDGARVYELAVRRSTTTDLQAAQIHDIGLRELARIRSEMEQVMRGTGFKGSFAEFIAHLHTDPRFFHASPEALLAGYRDIAKRIDGEMPRLFAELPRAPYGVRAMPAFRGAGAAEYYDAPSQDGGRAGYFNANALAWKTRPTWGMATLTAHEAMPGHHMQVARAQELKGLPNFRTQGGYNAFGEGWAVYAETLGREIGLYDDPYSLFGHLQWQAFRAARLVVDTGLHGKGWTREQAIEFMVERTGMERTFVTQEADRYLSWPGQALGYMIGKLKIQELRERAKARLGDRFDVRKFHNAVLDNGALPLDVLEKLIDEWVAQQAR